MRSRALFSTLTFLVAGLCSAAQAGWKLDTLELGGLFQGTVAGKPVWVRLVSDSGVVSARETTIVLRGTYRYEAFPFRHELQLEGTLDSNGALNLVERGPVKPIAKDLETEFQETGRFTGRVDSGFTGIQGGWMSADGKRRERFMLQRTARFRRFQASRVTLGPCQADIDPNEPAIRCVFQFSVDFLEWDGEDTRFGGRLSLSALLEGYGEDAMFNDSDGTPPLSYNPETVTHESYWAAVGSVFLSGNLGSYNVSTSHDVTGAAHPGNFGYNGTFLAEPEGGCRKLTLDRVISTSRTCRDAVRRLVGAEWWAGIATTDKFTLSSEGIHVIGDDYPSCCPLYVDIPYNAIPTSCFEPFRGLVRKGRSP